MEAEITLSCPINNPLKNISPKSLLTNAITVSVNANEMSIEQFAQNFAPDVVVLEPTYLADKVKERLQKAVEKYREFSL